CGALPWRWKAAPASCWRSALLKRPASPLRRCCGSRLSPALKPARSPWLCAFSSVVARLWRGCCAFRSTGRFAGRPLGSSMHWVAFHFPQPKRQALSRGHASPDREREALAAVAGWAGQFTPRVSLEPPQELVLEVGGSLGHFGGRWKLLALLRAGLTGL